MLHSTPRPGLIRECLKSFFGVMLIAGLTLAALCLAWLADSPMLPF